MYYGQVDSWNLRDRHMFDTLDALLAFHGPDAKAVVWAHNSHVGNAAATEMGTRGEFNIGQLCRERFGRDAFIVGFGTDHGTVAAAHDWGAPMQVMASARPIQRATSGCFTRPASGAAPATRAGRSALRCTRSSGHRVSSAPSA